MSDICNPLCAEFGGHPYGMFCLKPGEEAEIARVATQHQVRSAIHALTGLDLDMRAWLVAEDECHADEFRKTRRRALELLGHLEAMSQPKPEDA